jgi:uncharacterized membrane-anchored protein YitT (DUF2179 family)
MYFWKIEKLKEDIKNKTFSEKDRFIYAFIYIILSAVLMESPKWFPTENMNIWVHIDSISMVLIIAVGTLFAFNANGGNSGNDFLGRYFSILFVVSIRFIPLIIPIAILNVGYFFIVLDGNEELSNSGFEAFTFFIWSVAIYWRTCKHIGDLKNS